MIANKLIIPILKLVTSPKYNLIKNKLLNQLNKHSTIMISTNIQMKGLLSTFPEESEIRQTLEIEIEGRKMQYRLFVVTNVMRVLRTM